MAKIKLVIERGNVQNFQDLPPKSIALDGYCQGPAIELETQRFSFDHHDGCIRTFTSATCRQVLDAMLLGFDPSGFVVFINDVDGDTALAVWILQNSGRITDPKVRELVDCVANMDAHGPAYPVVDQNLTNAFYQAVMAPEQALRRNKTYGTANLEELLATCVENIGKLMDGEIEYAAKEDKRSFDITHTGSGWVMAKSDGFVFDLLYAAGHTKVVLYQELPDGSIAYTVGKKSEFVSNFPVGPHSKSGTILHALNQCEPGWGGGSTIGGAPRNADGSRSRMTPDGVFELIETIVKE